MGDIYENRDIVMAASPAANYNVGIRRLESRIILMTITDGPKEVGTITIRRPFDHSGYYQSYDSSLRINLYNGKVVDPLKPRAWKEHEVLHARRLVKFTGREMIFQCRERRACKCGEADVPPFRAYIGCQDKFQSSKEQISFAKES
jgi:hypothetical protein